VILIGNPNVGKSLLFKHLTSRYVTVSNFPGTTVDVAQARARFNGRNVVVIDTPGVNDLTPQSDDARVTRELLDRYTDATLIQVADAKNLRRALLLTLQLAELGRPLVLALNMYDELETRGGRIDLDRLSAILGVPVVRTVAVRNEGTDGLIAALDRAAPVSAAGAPPGGGSAYDVNRRLLDRVNDILHQTYAMTRPRRPSLGVRLGFWAMDPVRGLGILAVALLAIFWFVGLFGAGTLVDFLEVGVFEQRITPVAIRVVDAVLPFEHTHETRTISHVLTMPVTPAHEIPLGTMVRTVPVTDYALPADAGVGWRTSAARVLHDFLVGQFGVLSMALSYAFAIVLPIVTAFFLVFGVLEDSGYFPRMAIMVHRVFRVMGLNGKAVLPMILGLGCDTMATMSTRILESRKERLITTMLLALAIPCSAQLGVLLALMASLSPAGVVVWLGVVVGVVLLVGWLTARVIGGETSEFILEIPPMRRPQLSNVVIKTVSRLNWYLKEVIPLFVLGTAVLFVLDATGLLQWITLGLEPLVRGWLGLPREMAAAFLIGFMRRDYGAVYILDAATGPDAVLSPLQILVSMVTITLFMPCFANFLMIGKEHGMRTAWRMAVFIFPFAFLVGGLVRLGGQWLASI
jgi:ferrous iron transport protein B